MNWAVPLRYTAEYRSWGSGGGPAMVVGAFTVIPGTLIRVPLDWRIRVTMGTIKEKETVRSS
jgi:hypothetical protein